MSDSKWLEQQLKKTYLPLIATWADDQAGKRRAKQLLEDLRADWTTRGLITLSQQKNCMAQVKRAIKAEFGENHFSLKYITFTTAEYTELNLAAQARISDRNENIQYIANPDAIVAKAVHLLESREWAEIAAGLSVLTGRRVGELVSTAKFEPKSQWSVIFSGAKKRGDEEVSLEFEIPTLTTASKVCQALDRLRRELPETDNLSSMEINRSYSQPVAKACDSHFAGLIPFREGKDNLYTHISRSIYATIAVFWYCPPSVNETEFKASIQGHYAILTEKNPEKRRSIMAGRHYSDYEIADQVIAQHKGKRKGIKLGFGGVVVIDAFKKAEVKPMESSTAKKAIQRLRIWQEDREALENIFEALNISSDSTQMEKLGYLVSWIKERLERPVEDIKEVTSPTITVAAKEETVEPMKTEQVEPKEEALAAQPFSSSLEATLKQLTEVIAVLAKQQQTHAIAPVPLPVPQAEKSASPSSLTATKTKPEEAIRKKGDIADEKLVDIMNRIFAYNDAPERIHTEKWAVTIGLLKQFVKSQPRLQKFLKDHELELSAHYKKHEIDSTTQNYKHRRTNITDFISFE